jgi:hypothetical protein
VSDSFANRGSISLFSTNSWDQTKVPCYEDDWLEEMLHLVW